MNIVHPAHSKNYYYFPDDNTCLTATELQMIVDCVHSSKFLTEKDTERLIDKLLLLCSKSEANTLKDTSRYSRPTKNHNPDTLTNLGIIRQGIAQDQQIAFRYGQYNADKKLIGKPDERVVSPLQLIYCDDNYYLIAWNNAHENVITYRIDRIIGQARLLNESREHVHSFSDYDKKYYTQQSFHMFGGEQTEVTMVCQNQIMNIVIDQFGYDVHVHKVDEDHFSISPKVCASNQFFGWLMGLNGAIQITGP